LVKGYRWDGMRQGSSAGGAEDHGWLHSGADATSAFRVDATRNFMIMKRLH
jgi:hypothetical protein